MNKVIFDNALINLTEVHDSFVFTNKKKIISYIIPKKKWCILDKSYLDIQSRLKFFDIFDCNINTWHDFDVIVINIPDGIIFTDVYEALNLPDGEFTAHDNNTHSLVISLTKAEEYYANRRSD